MIKVIDYTKEPLTRMGLVASSCWGSTPSKQIGIDCIEANHGRVLEYVDVTLDISGYSTRMIRELYTHTQGVSRLQESTRYVNCGEFTYYIPYIPTKEGRDVYDKCMKDIQNAYKHLLILGVKKEDAANILPLGMMTHIVMKINLRAILHMAELRMCNRTLKEYRMFMLDLKDALFLLDSEWAYIMTHYMLAKCDKSKYCNEKKSCGKYPRKS